MSGRFSISHHKSKGLPLLAFTMRCGGVFVLDFSGAECPVSRFVFTLADPNAFISYSESRNGRQLGHGTTLPCQHAHVFHQNENFVSSMMLQRSKVGRLTTHSSGREPNDLRQTRRRRCRFITHAQTLTWKEVTEKTADVRLGDFHKLPEGSRPGTSPSRLSTCQVVPCLLSMEFML